MRMRFWSSGQWCVLSLVSAIVLSLAYLPAICRAESPAEQKIRSALSDPTTLEFIETPLKDVVDYLRELHGIEIQIDTKAIEDVGVGADTPMTRNLKGVRLRSALSLMLKELELTILVKDDVLQITTPAAVESYVTEKTYSVTDLVSDPASSAALAVAVELTFDSPPKEPQAAKLGLEIPPAKSAEVVGQVSVPPPPPPARRASQVVLFRGVLVVRANPIEHERIDELLAQLRRDLKGAPLPTR